MSCEAGYTLHPGTGCSICSIGCSICESAEVCNHCSNGYYLHESTCMTSCPAGFYANSQTNTCDPCHSACASCTGPTSKDCISCDSPYKLYNQTCVERCPLSTYDADSECIQCQNGCLVCQNGSLLSCSLCEKGKIFFSGYCVNRCPKGYYSSQDADNGYAAYCVERYTSNMKLEQTSEANTLLLSFENTTRVKKEMIDNLRQNIEIKIEAQTLNSSNFSSITQDDNKILIFLHLSQYIPSGLLINVSLDTAVIFQRESDIPFTLETTYATLISSEMLTLQSSTLESIASLASFSQANDFSIPSLQIAVLAIQNGVSSGIAQTLFSTQISQMTEQFSISWPPNVMAFFRNYSSPLSAGLNLPFSQQIEYDYMGLSSAFSSSTNGNRRILEAHSGDLVSGKRNLIASFQASVVVGLAIIVLGVIFQFLSRHIKHKRVLKILQWLDNLFSWNLLLTHLFCAYFVINCFSLFEFMKYAKGEQPLGGLISIPIICAVWSLIFLWFLYSHAFLSVKKKGRTEKPLVDKRLSCITAGCHKTHWTKAIYLPLQLTRMLLSACTIYLLDAYPVAQTASFLAINVLSFLYLLKYRPLLDKVLMIVMVVMEIFLVMLGTSLVLLASITSNQDNLSMRSQIGVFFLFSRGGLMACAVVMSFFQFLKSIYNALVRWKIIKRRSSRNAKSSQKYQEKKEKEEGGIQNKDVPEDITLYSVESVWLNWRKGITFTTKEDWLNSQNREKLQEIINWTRSFRGAFNNTIGDLNFSRNLSMPEKIATAEPHLAITDERRANFEIDINDFQESPFDLRYSIHPSRIQIDESPVHRVTC